MVKKLGSYLLGLLALGFAFPAVASAAQVAVKAASACGHCPFGCC